MLSNHRRSFQVLTQLNRKTLSIHYKSEDEATKIAAKGIEPPTLRV
jgi:hypothetical protein